MTSTTASVRHNRGDHLPNGRISVTKADGACARLIEKKIEALTLLIARPLHCACACIDVVCERDRGSVAWRGKGHRGAAAPRLVRSALDHPPRPLRPTSQRERRARPLPPEPSWPRRATLFR